TKTSVTFVVRPARVASRDPIAIERVKDDLRETIDAPVRAAATPPDADVILLAVGTEDLDAIRPLVQGDAPIVVLTPMLPKEWRRMRDTFGDRVLAAMPSFVAYARPEVRGDAAADSAKRRETSVVRYWLPPVATRIDEPRAGARGDAVRELARDLETAGISARFELGVHETNPATTLCAIPIAMGVALAGGLDALARDEALVAIVSRACSEGAAIARTVGRPEPPVLLAPILARALPLRIAAAAARRLSPESLHYLDEHFGKKLRAQHVFMAREMAAIAEERSLAHDAIDNLAARLALVRVPVLRSPS
ncbi:MAG TPA: hypothetical protein VIF62_09035, partial [Labilithrix sp.]